MAKINEGAFRQYRDGQDRMMAQEYMRDRELIRLAINDIEDKLVYLDETDNAARFQEIRNSVQTLDEVIKGYNEGNSTRFEDIQNTFVSLDEEVKKQSKSFYFQNVTPARSRDTVSNTDFYTVSIPYTDVDGTTAKLKRGFAKDLVNNGFTETARSFSKRHGATVTINASIFNTTNFLLRGVQIVDGSIINRDISQGRYILGIKEDGTLASYPPTTDPEAIIADGCTNALTSFIPLIVNGSEVGQDVKSTYTAYAERHPRHVIAQLSNKDMLVFTCDGRTPENPGMTCDDVIRILKTYNVHFAFMLDGGGSAQTVYKNTLLNRAIDGNGYTEREVPDFLYIAKEMTQTRDRDILDANKDIGDLNKNVADIKLTQSSLGLAQATLGKYLKDVAVVTDLNILNESGVYWVTASATANPTGDMSWAVLHLNYDADNAIQVGFPFHDTQHGMRMRRKNGGNWRSWRS